MILAFLPLDLRNATEAPLICERRLGHTRGKEPLRLPRWHLPGGYLKYHWTMFHHCGHELFVVLRLAIVPL